MMKRIKYFLFLIFTFMMFQPEVSAGSLSIWGSASNVTVGSKVTISVNAKNLAGTFNVTSSNNSVLSGGVSGEWLENDTYTFSFTAKSVGSAIITVTAVDAADFDTDGGFSGSKSVTLNVVAKKPSSGGSSYGGTSGSGGTTADKKEYSSDNTLKSLSVEGYDFEPKFDKDTTEYRLTVDESVEKLKISATANHSKASVSGTGEINLSNGENTVEIKVIAENGNEKIYKLIVTVVDQNPIKVKVDDGIFTIVKKNNDLIKLLDYYEEVTVKIDEKDVVAYENVKTKVTLVLLKDNDNNIKYYIYDNQKNTYTRYRSITVQGVTLQLLDTDDKLENYTKSTLELQDEKITYYKIKGSHKVGLIYGTNVKNGNTGYYVYDQNEETLSKYYDEEVKLYIEDVKELKNYLMIFMGAIAFVSIVIIMISLQKSKKAKKKRYKM